MRRLLLAAAAVLTAFLFQNSVFLTLIPLEKVPNLLLIVTVAYGLTCGKRIGTTVGLICGILSDVFIGDGGLGFYMLIYLYIGAFCGIFNRYVDSTELMFPLILTGVCDLVFGGYIYVFRFLIRGRLDVTAYITGTILPEMIYTVLAAVLLYPLISGIDRYLILTKKRRTSSFV